MSFGFSVGDFLAVGSLIKDIVIALRTSAVAEHRELLLEVHSLERALHEVEHLVPIPGQEASLNAIKAAALMCQYPLGDFALRLKTYELLEEGSIKTKRDRMKSWVKKVDWSLSMSRDANNFRAYLVAHVGSLNMRLITQGLKSVNVVATKTDEASLAVQKIALQAQESAADAQRTVAAQAVLHAEVATKLNSVFDIVSLKLGPGLVHLICLAEKIWTSNLRIIDMLTTNCASPTVIDMKHTWFQEPIRFEDAIGRVIPIPSEYGWSKVEAIIKDQFRSGIGHQKTFAGEYELYHSRDASRTISEADFHLVHPGMNITMALMIGQYDSRWQKYCPQPGCKSMKFAVGSIGHFVCDSCGTNFGLSKRWIPRPFRLLCYSEQASDISQSRDGTKKSKLDDTSAESINAAEVFRKMRAERKWFKNLRIHPTDLSNQSNALQLVYATDTASNPKRSKPTDLSIEIPDHQSGGSRALLMVMEELGYDNTMSTQELEELNKQKMVDLGFDSLIALTVLARLREELGIELPTLMDFYSMTLYEFQDRIDEEMAKKSIKRC